MSDKRSRMDVCEQAEEMTTAFSNEKVFVREIVRRLDRYVWVCRCFGVGLCVWNASSFSPRISETISNDSFLADMGMTS